MILPILKHSLRGITPEINLNVFILLMARSTCMRTEAMRLDLFTPFMLSLFPWLNAGMLRLHLRVKRRCLILNPRSAMTSSPSSNLLSRPLCSVICISLMQSEYNLERNVMAPKGHYSHKQLNCVGMYIIGPGQLLGMRSEWFLNMESSCVYDNTGTRVKLERFRHVLWHKFFRRPHKNMYQCICQELAPWQKYLACYSVTHRIGRQHVLCHTLFGFWQGLTAFIRKKLKHFSDDHWKCHQYHPKAWSYSLLVKSNYKLIRALLSC